VITLSGFYNAFEACSFEVFLAHPNGNSLLGADSIKRANELKTSFDQDKIPQKTGFLFA
jgi:hypothetical protein